MYLKGQFHNPRAENIEDIKGEEDDYQGGGDLRLRVHSNWKKMLYNRSSTASPTQ